MTTAREKYRKMATATRRTALRIYKATVRSWNKTIPQEEWLCDSNAEMQAMFKKDLKDLRKFAKLINQGQITRAANLIDRMDTAVYEQIPISVYNYVNKSVYGV